MKMKNRNALLMTMRLIPIKKQNKLLVNYSKKDARKTLKGMIKSKARL
jgi:hypothetical protein